MHLLSAHALLVTAIAIPYFGLMAGLCAYMASQVSQRDREPEHPDQNLADLDVQDDGNGPMLARAA